MMGGFYLSIILALRKAGYVPENNLYPKSRNLPPFLYLDPPVEPRPSPIRDCLPGEGTGTPSLSERAEEIGIGRLKFLKEIIPQYINLNGSLKDYNPGEDAGVLRLDLDSKLKAKTAYDLFYHASPHQPVSRYTLAFDDPKPTNAHQYFSLDVHYPRCTEPETVVIKGILSNFPYSTILRRRLQPIAESYFNFSKQTQWLNGRRKFSGTAEENAVKAIDPLRRVDFLLEESKKFMLVANIH